MKEFVFLYVSVVLRVDRRDFRRDFAKGLLEGTSMIEQLQYRDNNSFKRRITVWTTTTGARDKCENGRMLGQQEQVQWDDRTTTGLS